MKETFKPTSYEPIKITFGDEDKDGYFPYTNRALWIKEQHFGDNVYYCSECHRLTVIPPYTETCPFCHSKMTMAEDYVEPEECHNPDLEARYEPYEPEVCRNCPNRLCESGKYRVCHCILGNQLIF